MVQNPTIPVFDHLSMKNDHLSNEMIEFQEQHYAALPLANNPLIGPGHTGPWYDWVMLGWAPEDNWHYTRDVNGEAADDDDHASLPHGTRCLTQIAMLPFSNQLIKSSGGSINLSVKRKL